MAKKKAARKPPTPRPASTPSTPRSVSGPASAGDNKQRADARRVDAEQRRKARVSHLKGRGVKVQATKLGFYGLIRRRRGDVFVLEDPSHFSAKWMVKVSAATPERVSTGADELKRQHDRTLNERLGVEVEDDGVPADLPEGTLNPLDV